MKLQNQFKKIITAALLVGLSIISVNALAQDQATLSYKTEKITDTIYMISGEGGFTGGNVGLSVGSDGVAMIDNGVSGVIEILKAEIAKITKQPIDYMINTHIHGDHIGNNQVFGEDGAKIVSHENLRASLIKDEKNSGPASFPVLTFSDQMTIHLNGDAAQISHFDHAHTDGDAVVYFKKNNVLHTGDIMFNNIFPYIDGSNGGSVDGVIRALEGIATMINDETKVIPGHGALANKDDVLRTLAMVTDAKALVGNMVGEGKTDEEVLEANPLSVYESYSWAFITTEKMTQQLLAGFKR
ncbi:MAG: cyclase [Arenicella sp.]|jgi:cyclase